jgi:hypothetical protein
VIKKIITELHHLTSVRKKDERQFLHNDNIFCLHDLHGTDVPKQITVGADAWTKYECVLTVQECDGLCPFFMLHSMFCGVCTAMC